ncbi:Nipped-B-like protein B [Madurella fahalii]|uniref:Nipped-B-like protein B n=1 Tax=Madurella fahalii TaxID=1157608 RepID=A0ABQ0GHB9_9PEZI
MDKLRQAVTVIKLASRDKKLRKAVEELKPLVQTIQAGAGTYAIGKVMNDVGAVVDNVGVVVDSVSKAAAKVGAFIPSMQVMGRSFADSARIFASFNSIAMTAGIAANVVVAYQGVQVLQLIDARLKDMAASLAAQTALIAQKDFPQYVYDMIRERITQTSLDPSHDHWFFVYHPDNDWYPGFYRLLEKEMIGPEFCGYTNQIDTAFVFMLAARRRIQRKEQQAQRDGRPIRPTKLHLLIPAYQPVLIFEALKIPEEIGDFVMEGRINNNREFVWLNLPEDQRHYLQDIGRFVPPNPGWFDWAMSVIGLAEAPPKLGEPRVLGTRQGAIEADGDGDVADEGNKQEVIEDQTKQRATPLQQRHKRHSTGARSRVDYGGERDRRRRGETVVSGSTRAGRS